jgi:hypothetical protein
MVDRSLKLKRYHLPDMVATGACLANSAPALAPIVMIDSSSLSDLTENESQIEIIFHLMTFLKTMQYFFSRSLSKIAQNR